MGETFTDTIYEGSILTHPDRFIAFNDFSHPDPGYYFRQFFLPIRRYENRDRFANNLTGSISKEVRGSRHQ